MKTASKNYPDNVIPLKRVCEIEFSSGDILCLENINATKAQIVERFNKWAKENSDTFGNIHVTDVRFK